MKKIVVFTIVFALVLGLCACGGGQGSKEEPSSLQVGFGRVDISPDIGVGMAGFGNNETRRVTGYLDYLYMTCIAFTEGDDTILLYTVDLCALYEETQKEILRKAASGATNIPEGNILFTATHTHSGPQPYSVDPLSVQYRNDLGKYAVDAAKAALEDRAPATLLQAKTNLEKMTFCRHYKLEDGTYMGSNFNEGSSSPIVGYATEADNEMILLKCERGEDKQDILLVNWQGHADHAGAIGYTMVSADFPGAMRWKVEEETDMLVAYFSGASGNLNVITSIAADSPNLTMQQYGETLGGHVIDALDSLTVVDSSGVGISQVDFTLQVDHSQDHRYSDAEKAYLKYIQSGYNRKAGEQLAEEYGFSSIYEARGIYNKYPEPATKTVELTAFHIGDIGFITANYEMFTEQGQYIKANSPFETTIIGTAPSVYFPSEAAYEYDSYEAVSSKFEKGHAEIVAQEYVRLLEGLK